MIVAQRPMRNQISIYDHLVFGWLARIACALTVHRMRCRSKAITTVAKWRKALDFTAQDYSICHMARFTRCWLGGNDR